MTLTVHEKPLPLRLRSLLRRLVAVPVTWQLARRNERARRTERNRFPTAANSLLAPFKQTQQLTTGDYEQLVRYFAEGWATYRTDGGEGARYPGHASWSGDDCDRLEGFARVMPLFCAWMAGGRASVVTLLSGQSINFAEEFKRGLLTGTDPADARYWGAMPGKSNQRIVEAADVALALWLSRRVVWDLLQPVEQTRVVAWLAQVDACEGLDNNWHLFFVLIDRVLHALGHSNTVRSSQRRFDRIKEFHLGDGWFVDGPTGRADYYNAWGFHYALSWIRRIDPEWNASFIADSQRRFLGTYPYLIGPDGFPAFGRSLIYRMAAPVPLVLGCEDYPDLVSPGLARRALDATWCYFIRHGAVSAGAVTQGYHGDDIRLIDPYSGPASAFWSLRSLIAAFAFPVDADFWQYAPEPLPVEQHSFAIDIAGPRWTVRGDARTGEIEVEMLSNQQANDAIIPPLSRWRQIQLQSGKIQRPRVAAANYERRRYSNLKLFFD